MAGQSDVDQTGDHHSDTEHPSGGQEREGEEIPHQLRGSQTCGESKAGGNLTTGQRRRKPKKKQ